MSKSVLFETQNLTKYYKSNKKLITAVDHVNLKIFKGETLSVVGESGSGKTTLGRLILGIIPSSSGQILFKGEPIQTIDSNKRLEFNRCNQMIYQDPYSSLNPRMTIGSIVEEGLKVHESLPSSERQDRVRESLLKVGLTSDFMLRFPHELSGGQRQRVGIARSLIVQPEFIICDEPISALDVSVQAQIINLLIDLQIEFNLTYLFISHDLSVVSHLSDRIAVMYQGRIVELGTTEDIINNPQHPYTQLLFSSMPTINKSNNKLDFQTFTIEKEIDTYKEGQGCVFYNRCARRQRQCHTSVPKLIANEEEHWVACYYPNGTKERNRYGSINQRSDI